MTTRKQKPREPYRSSAQRGAGQWADKQVAHVDSDVLSNAGGKKTKKPRGVRAWAITGRCGLYIGHWHTRAKAIREHCSAYLGARGLAHITTHSEMWAYRRKRGDRVVRVSIKVIP